MNRMTPQFGDTKGSQLEGVASKSPADPANIMCPAFHSNSSDRNAQQLCDKVIEYAPNIACPCSDNDKGSNDNRMPFNETQKENNVTTAAYGDKDVDDHSDDDEYEGEFENDLMPGTLKNGADYEPISVLAEGWVHVKGTGNDWFGSRGWKARYVKLVLAEVDGYDVDVPLLLIYWYPTSDTPSTAILLDSTLVVPIDKEDPTKWNSYQFKIVHLTDEHQCTRTFTAPHKGRNTWVSILNETLAQK